MLTLKALQNINKTGKTTKGVHCLKQNKMKTVQLEPENGHNKY